MSQSIRSLLFRVIDLETTGLDTARDDIVEIGWVIVRGDGVTVSSGSTLVNPGRPIPPGATAIHGITDHDVANAPSLDEALARYPELVNSPIPAVAHNAAFDSAFIRRNARFSRGNPRFLCTMRLAQNLMPGYDNYQLVTLANALGIGAPAGDGGHRALSDAAVAGSLFTQLLNRYFQSGYEDNFDDFARFSSIQRMPFGKHRGTPLQDVPKDYVGWLLTRELDTELRNVLNAVQDGTFKPVPAAGQEGSILKSLFGRLTGK
jgi:exodeoxyribonuclease X